MKIQLRLPGNSYKWRSKSRRLNSQKNTLFIFFKSLKFNCFSANRVAFKVLIKVRTLSLISIPIFQNLIFMKSADTL